MLARRLLLSVGLLTLVACNRPPAPQQTTRPEQSVPGQSQANQTALADFAKTWRQQFISQSPDLARPVRRPEQPVKDAWRPHVVSQCVMTGAQTVVPEVTLTWSEAPERPPQIEVAQQAPVPQTALPRVRFDLSLHYDGLRRNYYSAAMATNQNEPFRLPSNSPLINDQAAVLVTGPGLFPRLHNYAVQPVQDPATRISIAQHTLVLRDLSHGLTYNLALDRPAGAGWNEEGRVAFATPVCPIGF